MGKRFFFKAGGNEFFKMRVRLSPQAQNELANCVERRAAVKTMLSGKPVILSEENLNKILLTHKTLLVRRYLQKDGLWICYIPPLPPN